MAQSLSFLLRRRWITLGMALLLAALALAVPEAAATGQGQWVTGDHHSHTRMSDGDSSLPELVDGAFAIGELDWMASADHGGWSKKDALGVKLPTAVWMWQMFLTDPTAANDFGWPVLLDQRAAYPDKVIVQGLEWGVKSADEAKVGVIGDEPLAISDFEYMFDKLDLDTSRAGQVSVAGDPLIKQNTTWAGSLAGVTWLQEHYAGQAYAIISHPSRALKWTVGQFRAFNDAAPDVAFGFAGIPGSQKELPCRGGYDEDEVYVVAKGKKADREVDWDRILEYARTYGGTDYMVAKVGGLWDSLLGEGREWWMFSDSDFHNPEEEFWPGEYSKDHTWVGDYSAEGIVAGLRAGNSFSVQGQLIDGLEFSAASAGEAATMGGTLTVDAGQSYTITIKFKSPEANNYGDSPEVDHIDLIAGEVGERYTPADSEYLTKDTNDTTTVLASFGADDWSVEDGWSVVTYEVPSADGDMYYRLRGTNMGIDVPGQTDVEGNPLADYLEDGGSAENPTENAEWRAWADLWFYSNPIFVDVE
jgi:hypothetical protein